MPGPGSFGVVRAGSETLASIVDQVRTEVKAGIGLLADPGRSALTAECVIGAVFSVVYARLQERDDRSLLELLNPLMAMIVLPYLGPAAAEQELARPRLRAPRAPSRTVGDPLAGLNMRITHRTLLVLTVIAAQDGQESSPCNREVAAGAGITDPGQISKLLVRLQRLGLIQNTGDGQALGERNAWTLTPKGEEVQRAIRSPGHSHRQLKVSASTAILAAADGISTVTPPCAARRDLRRWDISRPRFPTDWRAGRGPHGGYLAAMLLRSLTETVADPARAPCARS